MKQMVAIVSILEKRVAKRERIIKEKLI